MRFTNLIRRAFPHEYVMPSFKAPIELPKAPVVRIEETYTDFIKQLNKHEIKNVVLYADQSQLIANTIDNKQEYVILPNKYDTLALLMEQNISVKIQDKTNINETIVLIGESLFIIFVVLMGVTLIRSSTTNIRMFGLFDKSEQKTPDTKFDDVGGSSEAKESLKEIVAFLEYPENYTAVGAKIPKGVLLYGPPGCSKTLLARAVAGEANVPFISCSGSDFIEMFVGIGASRIRDLFKKAQSKTPCIIFIDEIDTIGKQRGLAGTNDERDQTINQLLTLMDGFETNTGIIVIAATNRPDILDDALLRPGRFDRIISVNLPDLASRKEIFAIHIRDKPIDKDVSIDSFARRTVGLSGADIMNICNEAAIYAARDNSKIINNYHFEQSLEKSMLGEARKTLLITDEKKSILAYHEAGHALTGLLLKDYDIVRKVSIIPRGDTGGATYFEPTDDQIDLSLVTREYLESQIMVALGGRISESIVFGTMKITSGASGDLQAVYSIAYDMIAQYGFNETLGPISWIDADAISDDINKEIQFLVEVLYNKTYDMLSNNEDLLHRIAKELIEKETLSFDDLQRIIQEENM